MLDKAARFYSQLLGTEGRSIRGSRHYFDCGPVILALLDPTPGGETASALPDYIYFSVRDLGEVHRRAGELGCLSQEDVHDKAAGEIVTRPLGRAVVLCSGSIRQWTVLCRREHHIYR